MSQQIYDAMMKAAIEADFAQKLLDELRARGVADAHIAMAVVRVERNKANTIYETRRRQYGREVTRAYAASRELAGGPA